MHKLLQLQPQLHLQASDEPEEMEYCTHEAFEKQAYALEPTACVRKICCVGCVQSQGGDVKGCQGGHVGVTAKGCWGRNKAIS